MKQSERVDMKTKLKTHFGAILVALTVLVGAPAVAAVDLPGGQYTESVEDLRIKVMGGYVVLSRAWIEREWHFNSAWDPLKFEYDSIDGTVKTITRTGADYKKTTADVFVLDARNTITKTSTGYRWRDRSGNWIDYNEAGRITAYGDRNDVKVTFQYNSNDQLEGVFDHFGTQVLWYEYTNGKVSAIRDLANRRVEYRYTGNQLTTVVDVLGNTWTYTYQPNKYTDYRCTIEWQYINGQLVKVADRCDPIEVDDGTFRLISRTDPELRKLTLGYGADGRVTSVKDAANNTTTYRYDYDATKKQYYVKQTSPAGKVTESWYDDKSKVIRQDVNGQTITALTKDGANQIEQDQRGLQTRKEYDQWENLTKITYPDGASVAYKYEPVYSNVTEKVNENGVITKYEYDVKGNLTRLTEAYGRPEQKITKYEYDQYGEKTRIIKMGDQTTTEATVSYEYDNFGNVASITDPEQGVSTLGHDVLGNIVSEKDQRGKSWKTSFNSAGWRVAETNPLNQIKSYEYDKTGKLTKIRDAGSKVTTLEYDARGNLKAETDAMGGRRLASYDFDGQLVRLLDQENNETSYEYDAFGRMIAVTYPDGSKVRAVYGYADDQIAKIVYPTFTRSYKYSSRGRVVEQVDSGADGVMHATTYTHDAVGNVTKITDNSGSAVLYEYDAFRRLVAITDANGNRTEQRYDNRGNLIELKTARGSVHRFEYSKNDKLLKQYRPLGDTVAYAYDKAGNLISKTDGKGHVRVDVYDDANRIVNSKLYGATDSSLPERSIHFSHGATGMLTSYDDGSVRVNYEYDDLYRKVREVTNYGAFTAQVNYEFYGNSLKKSLTYPGGEKITFSYKGDRIATIGLPVGPITYNSYNWLSPKQVTLPGGTIQSFSFDSLMRTTEMTVKDPAQSNIAKTEYGYDAADNLSRILTLNSETLYQHDELSQLQRVINNGHITEEYIYDANGNRKPGAQSLEVWDYNENDELTRKTDETLTYDRNGNLAELRREGMATQFSFDLDNRLQEVRDQDNKILATYYYSPFGHRLWKDVNGTKTYFVYSDEGLIGEFNGDGKEVRAYGFRPGSTWGTDPVFMRTAGKYYFYINNHLGAPVELVDTSGQIKWSATYSAFGGADVSSSDIINNLRLPGQYYDVETGLHYNYERYYDPKAGRFISPDPLGLNEGANLYAYVDNNPLRLIDPFGLCKWQFAEQPPPGCQFDVTDQPDLRPTATQKEVVTNRGEKLTKCWVAAKPGTPSCPCSGLRDIPTSYALKCAWTPWESGYYRVLYEGYAGGYSSCRGSCATDAPAKRYGIKKVQCWEDRRDLPYYDDLKDQVRIVTSEATGPEDFPGADCDCGDPGPWPGPVPKRRPRLRFR